MRVLQIHNRYTQGGGEDTISDAEAALLRRAGHEVARYRVDNPDGARRAATALAGAAWNPVQAHRLRVQVRELRPDVAHVHNTWFTLSPQIFHVLHTEHVPIVMTLQNYRLLCANALLFRDGKVCTDCVGSHAWRGVAHSCYRDSRAQSAVAALTISLGRARGSFDLVSRFLAPSDFVRDLFVDAGLAADRLTVRSNFVPDPGPRSGPAAASDTVVYIGRLSTEKGVDVLLAGWRAAGAQVAGLRLVVVGDGPLRDTLAADAPDGVEFVGWRSPEDVGQLLLGARALVMPTQWLENFGRVIIEAMAAGLPVLASNIATPAEIVRQLGESWVVPPASAAAWADGLSRLRDDAHVEQAGHRARALWEGRYGPDVGLRTLEAVYRDVIAPHTTGAPR